MPTNTNGIALKVGTSDGDGACPKEERSVPGIARSDVVSEVESSRPDEECVGEITAVESGIMVVLEVIGIHGLTTDMALMEPGACIEFKLDRDELFVVS